MSDGPIERFVDTVLAAFEPFLVHIIAGFAVLLTAFVVVLLWFVIAVERNAFGVVVLAPLLVVCTFWALICGIEAGWWR